MTEALKVVRKDSMRRSVCGSALALLLVAACSATVLGGERICCLLIGSVQPAICPLPGFFREDPLFTYESDPHCAGLDLDERRRLDRLYFPRTRQILLTKFDMVFFADPYIDHFTPGQFQNLYQAFTEDGMPCYFSFGPSYGHAIQGSILNDILPISHYHGYIHQSWYPSFRRERDPVYLPFVELGMEHIPGSAYGEMKPREGALIWADMVPLNLPWIVSWRPGGKRGGIVWVFADEFNLDWWGLAQASRDINPYAIDMVANMVLYSLGRPLIRDIHARRAARHSLCSYRSEKMLVISILEWADIFGANTLGLSSEIASLDIEAQKASDMYLQQQYDSCVSTIGRASEKLSEIASRAVRLKDQALFWVYLSEWLAVTSACILGSLALWSLMIRRKLYRAVQTTKLLTEE